MTALKRRTVAPHGIAAALCLLLAGSSFAQSPPAPRTEAVETFQDWVYRCVPKDDAQACSIIQDQSAENGTRLMAFEIRHGGAQDDLTAILLLPFGLDLEAGVSTQVDGDRRSTALPFLTCLPTGCVTTFPIAPTLLQRMQSGGKMTVFLADVSGRPLTYSISLMGLTAALDRLSKT